MVAGVFGVLVSEDLSLLELESRGEWLYLWWEEPVTAGWSLAVVTGVCGHSCFYMVVMQESERSRPRRVKPSNAWYLLLLSELYPKGYQAEG